jgi:O-antigen/teichoic acid export membrane protein
LPSAAAGQADASFASLATFVVQVYAVRSLAQEELGTFALTFSAFVLIAQIPTQLIYIPHEILAIGRPAGMRIALLRTSLPRGLSLGLLCCGGLPLGVLPFAGAEHPHQLWVIIGTGALTSLVSPLQDHIRRLFHAGKHSWAAAIVSMTHFVITLAFVTLPLISEPSWVPFGALLVANVISTIVGLAIARDQIRGTVDAYHFRQSVKDGSWLLASSGSAAASTYVSYAVVIAAVGPGMLGIIEGVRVLTRPVYVVAQGLVTVFSPRSMEMALARDRTGAKRWRRRFAALLVVTCVPYLVALLSPLGDAARSLLPNAFSIPYLAELAIAVTVLVSLALPYQAELMGSRRLKALAFASAVAGAVEVVTIYSVTLIGAFGFPVSLLTGLLVRWSLVAWHLGRVYEPDVAETLGSPTRDP